MNALPIPHEPVRTTIPARIDRLPWSPFHTRMVIALSTCWILDGLEIEIAKHIGKELNFGLSPAAIGGLATAYLLGEVFGALYFGALSDQLGRRRLFFLTLTIYFTGSFLSACVIGPKMFALIFLYLTRIIAGIGIGGEYAAINSMIDELIPAPYRGRVDIAVNGTYWFGALIAAAVQIPLLSGAPGYGWRIALLLGPVLAVMIVFVRRQIPESPRWLIMHGRPIEAEKSIDEIERQVKQAGKPLPTVDASRAIEIKPLPRAGYLTLLRVLFRTYPSRATLGATLMITQSFLYNAIFFSNASVLENFFHVDKNNTPIYDIPFAIGNLLGPLVLGRLFDKIGRRYMISQTYLVSGVLLVGSACVFRAGGFTATTQTLTWCVIFFFASAGASAAYLTVSEIFPMEVRAKAIAVFFAIAQACGSIAPLFYGLLMGAGNPDRSSLFVGFLVGAAAMIVGGLIAVVLAVDAENKPLEDIALPLSVLSPEPAHEHHHA